jgi:ABC-type antimicrobial peptide transport system permease subunit
MRIIDETQAATPRVRAARPPRGNLVPSLWRLAGMQLRQTWRLLGIMGLGLVLVLALIGSMPIFANIAMTTGLRAFLSHDPTNLDVSISSSSTYMTPFDYGQLNRAIDSVLQPTIQQYMQGSPLTSVQVAALPMLTKQPNGSLKISAKAAFALYGFPLEQASAFMSVVQGRLPSAQSTKTLELAIDRNTANTVGLQPGSTFYVRMTDVRVPTKTVTIPVEVVGIIAPIENASTNAFWQTNSLVPYDPNNANVPTLPIYYRSIVSQPALLSLFQTLGRQTSYSAPGDITFEQEVSLFWFYSVDPLRIDALNLSDIITQFDAFSVRLPQLNTFGALSLGPITTLSRLFDPNGLLSTYSSRQTDAQVPITVLVIGLLAVAVFFAALLSDLLIERQAATIALLRSRGFSRRQLFSSLVLQGLMLTIVAVVLGIVLMYPAASLIARLQLSGYSPAAPVDLPTISNWYVLATALAALLAFLFAIERAVRLDMLALRRESGRATRPLWQRLNLDIVAVAVGLIGLGISIYLTEVVGGIDPQVDRLLSPIKVIAPVFLLIALLLFSLRLFSVALQASSHLAARFRAAPPVLALAQIARAPGPALQMILLLALATGASLFTLAYVASQGQRAADVAAQQTGADFSGQLVINSSSFPGYPPTLASITSTLDRIQGVTAASVGFTTVLEPVDSSIGGDFSVLAVDTDTYAQVARWPSQDAGVSVQQMMAKLSAARIATIEAENGIPAIVDATTWSVFHLKPGAPFLLSPIGYGQIDPRRFVAVGEVQAIPGVPPGQGGILADLAGFSSYMEKNYQSLLSYSTAWLRTKSDAASLSAVRAVLNSEKYMVPGYNDRRLILEEQTQEPLNLTLVSLLAISVVLPLILALIGMLVAAQLQMRRQIMGYALLRALGATPRQITRMLLWQQAVVYLTGLGLGALAGLFLSVTLLPNLIFTSVPPGNNPGASIYILSGLPVPASSTVSFAVVQQIPPVQVVVPPSSAVVLGIMAVVGALILGIMVAMVARTSLAQTLRLNED